MWIRTLAVDGDKITGMLLRDPERGDDPGIDLSTQSVK